MAFPVNNNRLGLGLAWDCFGDELDLDIQAVIVNGDGVIVDAVYYNNLMACNMAVGHTGDWVGGIASSYNEMIWVSLSKLPANVCLIIFVVASSNDGHLRDAQNGCVHIVQDSMGHNVTKIPLQKSGADVAVVALMHRDQQGCWGFQEVEEPADYGSHFLDILEPTIGDLIRERIPGAPRKQAISFVMEKGSVMDLPTDKALTRMTIRIGGAMSRQASTDLDMDIAAVLYRKDGTSLGTVSHENLSEWGLTHGGDAMKDGNPALVDDSESLSADLLHIPDSVEQIFFIVTVYTLGGTFADLADAWCRVVDQNANELAKYVLTGGHEISGMVIARLFRSPSSAAGKRWGFQALGEPCQARAWSEASQTLDRLFKDPTHEATEMKVLQGSSSKDGKERKGSKDAPKKAVAQRKKMVAQKKRSVSIVVAPTYIPAAIVRPEGYPRSGSGVSFLSRGSGSSSGELLQALSKGFQRIATPFMRMISGNTQTSLEVPEARISFRRAFSEGSRDLPMSRQLSPVTLEVPAAPFIKVTPPEEAGIKPAIRLLVTDKSIPKGPSDLIPLDDGEGEAGAGDRAGHCRCGPQGGSGLFGSCR